jgi:hypothetical protein
MIAWVSVRRKAWWRIVVVSLVLAIILGVVQYFYQMRLIDGQAIDLANAESQKALAALILLETGEISTTQPELDEIIAALQDHFVIVELYDSNHKKRLEQVAERFDWVEKALKSYSNHGFDQDNVVLYRRLQLSGNWFWQIVMPLKHDGHIEGYFEGVTSS